MDKITRGDFVKLLSAAAAAPLLLGGPRAEGASAADEAAPATPAADNREPDSRRFRRAVIAGDKAAVGTLLAADPALAGGRDERGRSMLVLAYLSGHPEIAALLRPHLPELDLVEAVLADDRERVRGLLSRLPGLAGEPHPAGGTAVHAAARFGRVDLLGTLGSNGGGYNSPAGDPAVTPIRLAAEYLDPVVGFEMIDLMLGNGGDPTVAQGDGVSALHAAATAGSAPMVRALIYCGADPAARTPAGETPLDRARRHGGEVAEILARPETLRRRKRTSRYAYTADGAPFRPAEVPPLPATVVQEYVGVSHGNFARMRELLAIYPRLLMALPVWDELGVEAGAHVGNSEIVQLQLDSGAPASLPTAAMMGLTPLVRKLLAEDPERAHEPGAHNMPSMWYPAIGGGGPEQLEIARLLLAGGADANAEKRGQTALHWAARGGQVEMAELLLAHGADANARMKTKGGEETPLAQAVKADRKAVADLLRRHGGK